MLLRIETDEDLKNHFHTAIARIKSILPNTPTDHADLSQELRKLFKDNTLSHENQRQIIEAILTIVKSKPFWEEAITIESDQNLPEEYLLTSEECRDNLMLNIAKFYSNKCEQSSTTNHKYHVCQWIKYLHNFCI